MLRKLFLSVLIISLLITFYSMKVSADERLSANQFPDLPTGWSKEAVVRAIDNGLLYGIDGKILPKDYLTRAQLAAIVNRAFGTATPVDISQYTDVPIDSWFYEDLSCAVSGQTLVGFDNKLYPNKKATREEAFAVLARVVNPSQTSDLTSIEQFSDFNQISLWARNDLAAMVESGYMHGAGGKLQPKTRITREEFAYVIDQFSDQFVNINEEIAPPPEAQEFNSEFGSESEYFAPNAIEDSSSEQISSDLDDATNNNSQEIMDRANSNNKEHNLYMIERATSSVDSEPTYIITISSSFIWPLQDTNMNFTT